MVSFFVYKNSTTSSLSRIQMRQSRVSIIDKVGAGEPKGHHKRTDRHPSKKVVCLVMVKVIGTAMLPGLCIG